MSLSSHVPAWLLLPVSLAINRRDAAPGADTRLPAPSLPLGAPSGVQGARLGVFCPGLGQTGAVVQSSCISACCFQGLILPSLLLSPLHLLPPNHVGRWNGFFFPFRGAVLALDLAPPASVPSCTELSITPGSRSPLRSVCSWAKSA